MNKSDDTSGFVNRSVFGKQFCNKQNHISVFVLAVKPDFVIMTQQPEKPLEHVDKPKEKVSI